MNIAQSVGRLSPAATSFVAREKKLFIDGKWVSAASGETFDVIDPSTGLAVAAARRAFDDGPWATMSPSERGKLACIEREQ